MSVTFLFHCIALQKIRLEVYHERPEILDFTDDACKLKTLYTRETY